jgi:hypothetical protein
MFRALLAHLQEELYKQQLVYCVRIMPAVCYQGWSGTTPTLVASSARNMYRMFIHNKLNTESAPC